jgi:[histone H3]-lysine36 N-trimethyltransferase
MRQTQSRKVLFKLLTRIKMTDDTTALRQLMRLRGFSMMTTILEDYVDDLELVTLVRYSNQTIFRLDMLNDTDHSGVRKHETLAIVATQQD